MKTAGQRFTLDRGITLRRRRGPKAARRRALRGGLCLSLMLGLSAITSIETTYAKKPLKENVMNLKLYAHNLLNDWDQFECYNWLIYKESRWNTKAINGSHYGLGQMRNVKVKDLSGRAQIRWHIRYIKHRYDGDVCKALAHLEKRQWH